MTMFIEPLQREQPHTVAAQLLSLYDAYCEFNCYCAFLHQAHEGIVAQAGLDQETIDGIGMSGRCLVLRSLQIKQQLKEILALTQEVKKDP